MSSPLSTFLLFSFASNSIRPSLKLFHPYSASPPMSPSPKPIPSAEVCPPAASVGGKVAPPASTESSLPSPPPTLAASSPPPASASDDDASDNEDGAAAAPDKKKKKRKPKKKKAKGPLVELQSDPPRVGLSKIYTTGDWPVGEIQEYTGQSVLGLLLPRALLLTSALLQQRLPILVR